MDPVRAEYGGACVGNVVPALVGGRAVSWLPEPVRDARAVVLLVLDGLGSNAIDAHRSRLPALAGMSGRAITTVTPATTSAALTSLVTGLTPAQHAIVGFRMRIDGRVLNVLRWRYEDGHAPPDPFEIQRHDAFLGRPIPVVTKREFRTTGFTAAHLRGARFVGWSTTSTLVEHCRRLVAAGEGLVYAYYPGVDSVAHEFGLHDEFFTTELAFVDGLVGDLVSALPADVAVLVTSDHGQVHFGTGGWLELGDVADLVAMCSGDGRFRYLHAAPGATAELVAAARESFGHVAWVLEREELLENGWLGNDVARPTRRRVGDVVLAARDPVAFLDPALPHESQLVAGHASVTADEMLVPLLAARGTGTA